MKYFKKLFTLTFVLLALLACEPATNNSLKNNDNSTSASKKDIFVKFEEGFPKIFKIEETDISFTLKTNNDGIIYLMVLEAKSKTPTITQVISGNYDKETFNIAKNVKLAKQIELNIKIDKLKADTSYCAYICAVSSTESSNEVINIKFKTNSKDSNNPDSPDPDLVVITTEGLKALISEIGEFFVTAKEGINYSEYPIGSKALLQTLIDDANLLIDSTDLVQTQIDERFDLLKEAFLAFKLKSIKTANKTSLNEEILKVEGIINKAVIGTENGNYPQSAKDVLVLVLNDAKIVFNDTVSNQSVVDQKLLDLQTAKNNFLTKKIVINVDKSVLLTLINDVKTFVAGCVVGSSYGQYPQSALNTINTAIQTAETLYNDETANQGSIDSGFSSLDNALTTFKSKEIQTSDKAELKREIDAAELLLSESVVGEESGMYPQSAKTTLSSALDKANLIYNDKTSNQNSVDVEANKVKDAITVFRATMNNYTSIKYEMYIRGSFTGEMWSPKAFKLVGNNIWKYVDTLVKGSYSFKLDDSESWDAVGSISFGRDGSELKWMENPLNIILNVESTGAVTFTYNDKTEVMQISGGSLISGAPKDMWVSGDFGNPAVNEGWISYHLVETSTNVWETIIILEPGEYSAAFSEGEMFSGRIYGQKGSASWSDNSLDIEEETSPSDNKFTFMAGESTKSYYSIKFNYGTMKTTINTVGTPDKYIVGTFNNWTHDKMTNTNGIYKFSKEMTKGTYRFKLTHFTGAEGWTTTFGACADDVGNGKHLAWGTLSEDIYMVLETNANVTFTYDGFNTTIASSSGTVYNSPYLFDEPKTMFIKLEGNPTAIEMVKQPSGEWKGTVNIASEQKAIFKFTEDSAGLMRVFGTNSAKEAGNACGSGLITYKAGVSGGNHSIYFNFSNMTYRVQ